MTTETTPPEWAIEEACRRSNLSYISYKSYPGAALNAFARYIAQHEPAPVDPLREEAREIVARWYGDEGHPVMARYTRDGDHDNSGLVLCTLSGLRRGKELAEKKEGAR